jgi:transcription elongation factor GreA-like protein
MLEHEKAKQDYETYGVCNPENSIESVSSVVSGQLVMEQINTKELVDSVNAKLEQMKNQRIVNMFRKDKRFKVRVR